MNLTGSRRTVCTLYGNPVIYMSLRAIFFLLNSCGEGEDLLQCTYRNCVAPPT